MTTSNVPVRVPERQSEAAEITPSRPAVWRREKKPTRFIIKVGGVIPC
ncbi:MAG: hypothetical protein WEB59_00290 [Thermoanaerobaculia bacterium]